MNMKLGLSHGGKAYPEVFENRVLRKTFGRSERRIEKTVYCEAS